MFQASGHSLVSRVFLQVRGTADGKHSVSVRLLARLYSLFTSRMILVKCLGIYLLMVHYSSLSLVVE